jgi:hypothetical protein
VARIRVTPTRANGRPALAMYERTDAGLRPHGILLLDVTGDLVAGLDAFIDPALVPLFASPR